MKIAVVQHRLRESGAVDAEVLAQAVRRARADGARVVIAPELLSPDADPHDSAEVFSSRLGPDARGLAAVVSAPQGAEEIGRFGLLVGDACMDPEELQRMAAEKPDVTVLLPRSESDLQAEAVLEVALALSDSLSGLVLVADSVGAEPGRAGHGGSAIIFLGDVVAEAGDGDDVLFAEIGTPVAQPEPREPIPSIPPILLQRLANHRGTRPEMGYLADLTDGAGPA